MPVGSRYVGTSETGRAYRLGYGLGLLGGKRLAFELGLDGQRRESPVQEGAQRCLTNLASGVVAPGRDDFWKGGSEPMALSEKNRTRWDADGNIFLIAGRLKRKSRLISEMS